MYLPRSFFYVFLTDIALRGRLYVLSTDVILLPLAVSQHVSADRPLLWVVLRYGTLIRSISGQIIPAATVSGIY